MSETERLKLYTEVTKASLKNAERWIIDAKLLIEDRSFGHASALARFAAEEIAKAILCWYVSEEIWPEDNIITENAFRSHIAKNQTVIGLAFNILWQSQPMEKRTTKGICEPTDEEIDEAVRSFVRMASLMEERRKRAIYVDLNSENNRVSAPWEIKGKETKELLRGVEIIFRLVKYYVENYPDSYKEKLREYFSSLPSNVWKTGEIPIDFLQGTDVNE